MAKIQMMIDNLNLFTGLYESVLYNSDTDYYIAENIGGKLGDEVEYNFEKFTDIAGMACVDSLNGELYSDEVITGMEYLGIHSPKYYNYDTDSVIMEIEYNFIKLVKYCKYTNREHFNKYLKDNYTSYSGYTSFVENSINKFFAKNWFNSHKDIAISVMLEFYLCNEINLENHLQNMFETCHNWLLCNAQLV